MFHQEFELRVNTQPLIKTAERSNAGRKASLVYAASLELGYRSAYAQWQEKKGLISMTGSKGLSAAQFPLFSAPSANSVRGDAFDDQSRRGINIQVRARSAAFLGPNALLAPDNLIT
jgi:hypothetical protein